MCVWAYSKQKIGMDGIMKLKCSRTLIYFSTLQHSLECLGFNNPANIKKISQLKHGPMMKKLKATGGKVELRIAPLNG